MEADDLERIEKTRAHLKGDYICDTSGGGKAVTRALGDFHLKMGKDLDAHEQALFACPEIKAIERCQDDEFLLLADDGVWDGFTTFSIVKEMYLSVYSNEIALKRPIKGVCNSARDNKEQDNLSLAVLNREKQRKV